MATFKAMPAVRRKQLLLLVIGGLSLLAIAGAVAYLSGPSPADVVPPPAKPTTTNIAAPGADVNPSDNWRVKEGAQVQSLKDEIQGMKAALETERKAREDAQKKPQETPAAKPMPPEEALPRPGLNQGRSPREKGLPGSPPQSKEVPLNVGGDAQVELPQGPVIHRMLTVDLPDPNAASAGDVGQSLGTGSLVRGKSTDVRTSYLPVSILKAINLSGVNAPTGGQAQQNPNPILFRVINLAQLPNRFRADYRECFVTGAAVGDMSSERADITLDTLNCVRKNGEALEVKVRGYVTGGDGKAGMQGRLVTRQGSALAMSLLASVASGMGQAFSSQGTTQSVSALGTTQTVSPSQSFQVGMGQGMSKSAERLVQYYTKLADSMYPVIEVDAAQSVDLIVTRGVDVGSSNTSAKD